MSHPDPAGATLDVDAADLVSRFLAAIVAGEGATVGTLYHPDAVVDLTVPGWRFHRHGPDAIAEEYARWFAAPGHLEELERHPVAGGEVVTYLLTWDEDGVPHAAHHCHVLTLEGGRIAAEKVFCGGRWPASLLAEMEAADA